MRTDGDYISREAAIEAMYKDAEAHPGNIFWVTQHEALRNIPAADVRPVVMCGECKYWELSKIEPPFHVCTYVCGATFVRNAEDFCSRGEKREES